MSNENIYPKFKHLLTNEAKDNSSYPYSPIDRNMAKPIKLIPSSFHLITEKNDQPIKNPNSKHKRNLKKGNTTRPNSNFPFLTNYSSVSAISNNFIRNPVKNKTTYYENKSVNKTEYNSYKNNNIKLKLLSSPKKNLIINYNDTEPFQRNSRYNLKENTGKSQTQEDGKYDYFTVMKKLDKWDNEHCGNRKDDLKFLYNKLSDYYAKNCLDDEQKNLNISKNIISSKYMFKKLISYSYRKINKNLDNFYEQYFNNKNINALKISLKENNLKESNNKNKRDNTLKIINDFFLDDNHKKINQNINLENKIYENFKGGEKEELYKNITKNTMKFENDLRKELMFVNNIIYNKKLIKHEYLEKLNEILIEKNKLKLTYEENIAVHLKSYWKNYDDYSQHFKRLIKLLTPELNDDSQNIKNISDINSSKDIKDKSVSPHGRRKSQIEAVLEKNLLKQRKQIENFKDQSIYSLNKNTQLKIEECQKKYRNKQTQLMNEESDIEKKIKMKSCELDYYKKINDELISEHRDYYMKILKQGQDFRRDGLLWVVKNLMELQVNLEYHHFPRYLSHEQIDYLKKLAMNSLEKNQLKIVINVLKNKKNAERLNEKLKCFNLFENMMKTQSTFYSTQNNLNVNQNKRLCSINFDVNLNGGDSIENNDILNIKYQVDKKLDKVYKKNEEAVKMYLGKNVEELKMKNFIQQLKKGIYLNYLYGKNNNSINNNKNKSQVDCHNFLNKEIIGLLESFIGSDEDKDFLNLVLSIKNRLRQLDKERYIMIKKEKEYFAEHAKNIGSNLPMLKNMLLKQVIKNALFGTKNEYK